MRESAAVETTHGIAGDTSIIDAGDLGRGALAAEPLNDDRAARAGRERQSVVALAPRLPIGKRIDTFWVLGALEVRGRSSQTQHSKDLELFRCALDTPRATDVVATSGAGAEARRRKCELEPSGSKVHTTQHCVLLARPAALGRASGDPALVVEVRDNRTIQRVEDQANVGTVTASGVGHSEGIGLSPWPACIAEPGSAITAVA